MRSECGESERSRLSPPVASGIDFRQKRLFEVTVPSERHRNALVRIAAVLSADRMHRAEAGSLRHRLRGRSRSSNLDFRAEWQVQLCAAHQRLQLTSQRRLAPARHPTPPYPAAVIRRRVPGLRVRRERVRLGLVHRGRRGCPASFDQRKPPAGACPRPPLPGAASSPRRRRRLGRRRDQRGTGRAWRSVWRWLRRSGGRQGRRRDRTLPQPECVPGGLRRACLRATAGECVQEAVPRLLDRHPRGAAGQELRWRQGQPHVRRQECVSFLSCCSSMRVLELTSWSCSRDASVCARGAECVRSCRTAPKPF